MQPSFLYSIYCHKKFKRGDIGIPNSTLSVAITYPGTNMEAIVITTALVVITIKVHLIQTLLLLKKKTVFLYLY